MLPGNRAPRLARSLARWHVAVVHKARSGARTTGLRPEVMLRCRGVAVVCEASREMANAMHESFIRMTRTPARQNSVWEIEIRGFITPP